MTTNQFLKQIFVPGRRYWEPVESVSASFAARSPARGPAVTQHEERSIEDAPSRQSDPRDYHDSHHNDNHYSRNAYKYDSTPTPVIPPLQLKTDVLKTFNATGGQGHPVSQQKPQQQPGRSHETYTRHITTTTQSGTDYPRAYTSALAARGSEERDESPTRVERRETTSTTEKPAAGGYSDEDAWKKIQKFTSSSYTTTSYALGDAKHQQNGGGSSPSSTVLANLSPDEQLVLDAYRNYREQNNLN